MSDTSKRQFEYRMSKKVAELTQVVHMLFTRNHEKEVELEATKSAYEIEIENITADAKEQISSLKLQVDNLTKGHIDEIERLKKSSANEREKTEKDSKSKVKKSEQTAQDERKESQNLRDLLIRAQADLETLRQGMNKEISQQNCEKEQQESTIEAFKRQELTFSRKLIDQEKQYTTSLDALEHTNSSMMKQISELTELLDDSHKTRHQLSARNKQLEQDLRRLKKDFARKVSDVVHNQNGNQTQSANQTSVTFQDDTQDPDDELERLRREVKRYRLELSNRDWNFNRMFSDQKPIVIDPRAGKIGLHQLRVMQPQRVSVTYESMAAKYRELSGGDGRKTNSPRSHLSSANSSKKLPHVHHDRRHSNSGRGRKSLSDATMELRIK